METPENKENLRKAGEKSTASVSERILPTVLLSTECACRGQETERIPDIFLEIVMARNPEPLTETSVLKFKSQDFKSLRDQCLSRGQLFTDDTFPAEASSIGQKLLKGKHLSKLEWKRPQNFLLDDSDCWFLAALGSLTQNPQCLQKILMDQSYSHQYAGIFRFRFWQCGQWVEVVVDDRLPVIGKNFLFVHPRRGNQEFWPCLMEKAYAKLLGSYSQIHYGHLPDALVDLTGGVVTIVNLHSSPSDLLTAVKTAVKAGSMVACATPKGLTDESEVMENGLVSQHAYTVTGAEQIQYQRGWEEIIRLWNPWGNTEWKGRWRDGSQEWEESHDPRKSQLYENKDDGEFCFLPFAAPYNRLGFLFYNSAQMKNLSPLLTQTPQTRQVDSQFQQFQERLPPAFFSPFRSAAQGIDYVSKCNFTKSFHLSPGTYVVVPSAHRKEVEFLLRIFLKMPDKDRNPSSSFNLRALKGSLSENDSPKSIFYRYMDQGLDLDATQLQKLLNQEFLTACFPERQRSPVLLSSDLWKVIENTDFLSGVFISNELMGLMTLRYSNKSGLVSFPSLVCFLIRLETMT
ncbi:hypothetical protein STEG23_005521, partial [Scotinomys teguina]